MCSFDLSSAYRPPTSKWELSIIVERRDMTTNNSAIEIGLAQATDLPELLGLYHFLNPDDPVLVVDGALLEHWEAILNNPALHYVVARADGKVISTCALTIIPNLTRPARPYGLIENVVTHPDYRKRGIATQVLRHALAIAWSQNCYKVMLMTGSKQESTMRFYEGAGFVRGEKTGFVARRSLAQEPGTHSGRLGHHTLRLFRRDGGGRSAQSGRKCSSLHLSADGCPIHSPA
jgi:GNAT superfamily N-acetyltransferase